MTEKFAVDIVMGAYNCAEYLDALLQSLYAQTHREWRLVVRDDESQDETLALLAAAEKVDSRITLVTDTAGNLGCEENFHQLLCRTSARYIMYCDPDDVWHPQKIELTLREMLRSERDGCPRLVHCDSAVTDSNLNVLKDRFIGSRGGLSGLSAILFANCVQGCTAMMNASLRNQVLRVKPVLPYDYHAALIAAALGERQYIDEALLLYRQHSNNRVGAGIADKYVARRKISPTLQLSINAFPSIWKTLNFFRSELSPATVDELDDFSEVLFGTNNVKRIVIALRRPYGFYRRRDRLNLILYICNLPNV